MSVHIIKQSAKHTVTHAFSGKYHFFNVLSGNSGKVHDVVVKFNCADCEFMGREGIANGKMCSHIHAALKKIVDDGEVK